MSVKLALIALFRHLNLDFLIALRTAPSNSWANPVERIMSIVNIGLQGVGIMRRKMSNEFEKRIGRLKNIMQKNDMRHIYFNLTSYLYLYVFSFKLIQIVLKKCVKR